MAYHSLNSIVDMHVEISNRCNAACPMCARNDFGGATKSDLVLDEWTKSDIDSIFTGEHSSLQNVMFCGTHGDPCVAANSLYAVDRIKNLYDASVEFYSNASMRSIDWWANLGRLLSNKYPDHSHYRRNDLAIFSIDGLEDTNHLYRRRTNYKKIIENASAFINAGGIARWDFIVFKHNEHQVEEAERVAADLGFKQFRVRKTSRFDYSPDGPDKWRVKDKSGSIEYYLEPPSKKWRNPESNKFVALKESHGSIERYYDVAEIDCLYKNEFKRIYVNAYAKVYPCCYISDDSYPHKNAIYKDTQSKIFSRWGDEFNSLRSNSWQEILDHEWMNKELERSWGTNLAGGKLMRCARTCGKGYSPIKSQSTDTLLNG